MAEIAVGLATKQVADVLVGKPLNDFYSFISGELSLLLKVREEIQFIKDELQIMSSFLRNAEEMQDTDVAVRAWVIQVRELAYAVEDCIDEFSLHLPTSGSHNFLTAVWRRVRSLEFGSLRARHRIASKIQSIKSRVEEVSSRRMRYGISKISTSLNLRSGFQRDPQLASLHVKESHLEGIEAPKKKLVDWLLSKEQKFSLIAVVGEGGLGKTTLARKAYAYVSGTFMCCVWVTVSQSYHFEGLLRYMIRVLRDPPKDLDKMEKEELVEELKKQLSEKRYVIVFDDIWNIDAWRNLVSALPQDEHGSRVMMTTRNKELANACLGEVPTGRIFPHEKLSKEQAFTLFCKIVFDDHKCPDEFEEISRTILKRCDGLPLAIVSIAGVLASKPTKTTRDWRKLLHRLGSELGRNPTLKGMERLLTVSYNDLPYHVKFCFLYLSKFPEDSVIERKRIQRLWMAEGFVAECPDMSTEEVAESYFNELIHRHMIIPWTYSAAGKVKSFQVHDIMLGLIVSKSVEDNFVSLLRNRSTWIPRDVIRRLSVHTDCDAKDLSLSHVRSLTVLEGGVSLSLLSSSLSMLRVLDLEGCHALCNDHLDMMASFLHLKYLSLRKTGVSMLPKSLENLRNLETLDTRKSSIREMPAEVTKLRQLRSLRGDWMHVPKGIENLRSLQELSLLYIESYLRAHSGSNRKQTAGFQRGKFGSFKSFQKLVAVNDHNSKEVTMLKELGELTQLRKLSVTNLSKDGGMSFSHSLMAMSSSLRSLKVNSQSNLDFLCNLASPPLLLETLKLEGKLEKLPKWICSLNNVAKLFLNGCELGEDDIRKVGALPSLNALKLSSNAYKGESLRFHNQEFLSLRVLWVENIDELRSLHFEGIFAVESLSLVVEVVADTQDEWLTMQSKRMSIFGIDNLPRLEKIDIKGMYKGDLDAVQTAAEEHPNLPRVTSSEINDSHV